MLVFDRYYTNSSKSYMRMLCQKKMVEVVMYTSSFGVTKNKVQLNKMLAGAMMDPEFHRHATAGQMHSLTVAGTKDVPVAIVGATVIGRRELSSSHEETDARIVQHTLTRCMVGEVVSGICDATDVFALLLHFVAEMKPNGQLCMCSPVLCQDSQ